MAGILMKTSSRLQCGLCSCKSIGVEQLRCLRKLAPEIRLDGKTAIVTGSNTGIGKHTALDLCSRGCRVVMACRDTKKAEIAAEDILKSLAGSAGLGELITNRLDLSSLNSVRCFADEILKEKARIHILVNNAGVMMCPLQRTEDGFEMHFAANHLGHFLLTILLLPLIIDSAPSRIINVSSDAHKVGDLNLQDLNWERTSYSPVAAYAQSKLANILFTKELSRRLAGTNVNVYAVHPGAVRTELGRHLDTVYFPGFRWLFRSCFGWCLKTASEGAQSTIHCAVAAEAAKETGLYYKDCGIATPGPRAKDMDLAAGLWDISWKLTQLGDFDPFLSVAKSSARHQPVSF